MYFALGRTAVNESEKLVGEWARLWSSPDAANEDFEKLFSPECEYVDVPFGEKLRGHEETREFHERSRQSFPDFAVTLESVIADDAGAVCATWSMSGTHKGDLPGLPATGRSLSMCGVSVMRIVDGKIGYCTDYYDAAGMMRQLMNDE